MINFPRMWRFIFFTLFTLGLVFVLNRPLVIGDKTLPPLGKFLSPSHGFWQNAEKNAYLDNTIRLTGVREEIQIVLDDRLVPHIFAQNEYDLYYAQGYVTAMHRLWQLDISTRSAAGRISEVMGKRALDFDKSQRMNGMVFGAENTLKAWEDEP